MDRRRDIFFIGDANEVIEKDNIEDCCSNNSASSVDKDESGCGHDLADPLSVEEEGPRPSNARADYTFEGSAGFQAAPVNGTEDSRSNFRAPSFDKGIFFLNSSLMNLVVCMIWMNPLHQQLSPQ